jgi:hypothetical protein
VQCFADRVNEQDVARFLGLVDPEVELRTFRRSSGRASKSSLIANKRWPPRGSLKESKHLLPR